MGGGYPDLSGSTTNKIFPNGARKKSVFLTEVSAKESGEWDKKTA